MPANSLDDRKICEDAAARGASPLPPGVVPGAPLTLRGQRWQLHSLVTHDDCCELHVTGTLDAARRIFLWPFDRPAAMRLGPRLRAVRLRQWAAAMRRRALVTRDPFTPRVPLAAVDVIPFQLAPAIAMAAGASRVLLADEVGLGKTIQAGWIVADVLAREPAARVLLAVPAGLRRQWAGELSARFAIEAALVDARWLRGTVADLPVDVSPWLRPGVYIGSLDFLKRPDVAESIAAHIWDLLVIDEAHTASAPTDRHAAIARFAARARRVVAITATPYSGNSGGFASLTELGATRASDPPVMFRRSRQDVGDSRLRRHHFVRIRVTRAEARLQRLLERYSEDVWNEPVANVEGARLAVTILRKRALSSPAAAGRSLRRRLDLLQSGAQPPRQLQLFEDDDALDDEVAAAALAVPGLADAAREHRWLASLIAAADAAGTIDSKLRYLQRLIRRLGGESIVVFTEYRDTLMQLAAALPPSLQLHGGLGGAERAHVQECFNRDGGLLLATDAAAEGLNLHHRCRTLVNYELPWNPARLEQRIGRVDRIGQRRTVHALTLTARDTAEDLVIRNLARRLLRVVAALGPEDRLGAFLDDARTAGIVIGGNALDEDTAAEPAGAPLVVRDDGSLERAMSVAAQLAPDRRLHLHDRFSPDILVSSVRAATHTVPPGCALVIACSARTIDGFTAAEKHVAVHLSGAPGRPRSAGAARTFVHTLLQPLDARALVPGADTWFADASAAHAAAVQRRIERETGIAECRTAREELQPGLFDGRAVARAERDRATHEQLEIEHRRYIAALERSRELHLTCAVSAVLIAWR